MNLHKSLLLAASLGIASCSSVDVDTNSSAPKAQEPATSNLLTLHVVEASGGA